MDFLWRMGFVLLLVLLNGFFVASEFALIAVRNTRITELARGGKKSAKMVQTALKDVEFFISATQLGITIASLMLGWIGEPAIEKLISPHLSFLPHEYTFISSHSLAAVISLSVITYLHIVLGELVPKTIALQKSEQTALFVIFPLSIFMKVFRPFITLLNNTGIFVAKLAGFTPSSHSENAHSEEEIKMILSQSRKSGLLDRAEVEMVNNVFDLSDTTVSDVMVPRSEMVAFSDKALFRDVAEKIQQNPSYSRFPVYRKNIDKIIGFIHIKDVYKAMLNGQMNVSLSQTDLIRTIIKIPKRKKLARALWYMRSKKIHAAVIQDEKEKTTGLITMEDIVESLIGEIEDEFDGQKTPTRMVQ
ncbi:HlyC/CorC family transporter [Candidatus Roizmanbacteria bacterium]|nr:HlyC/CorC family transporter [Candidatus Roizmanbacteria bacterium]